MTIRPIVSFPDPRLFKPCQAIDIFDDNLRSLVQDLFDTMQAASGVGITAPHIGLLKRIVVLSLPAEVPKLPGLPTDAPAVGMANATAYQVYINPEITAASNDTVQFEEGSISMPGVIEKITRAARVTITYVDLDGIPRIEEAEGFRAVCHQHEIDQLDGVFWTEKLSRLKRERVLTRFSKLRRGS